MEFKSSLSLGYLHSFHKVSQYFGATIFTFDQQQRRLVILKSPAWYQKLFRLRLFLGFCMTTASIFQAINYYNQDHNAHKSHSTNVLLQAAFYISCHYSFIYINWTHVKKQREMVNFINAIIDFEQRELAPRPEYRENSEGSQVCKFILQNTALNIVAVMAGRFVATYNFPCLPDLAGNFLLKECQSESGSLEISLTPILMSVVKLGIVLWNWIVLSIFYIGFNCDLVCFSYLPCFFFNKCLQVLSRMIAKPTQAKRKVELLRQFQILLISYNDIHQRFGVVCGAGQSVIILTICSYALIRLGPTLIPLHIMFFLAAGTQAFITIVFVFGTLGNVYRTSEMVLQQAKKAGGQRSDLWFRRVLKSWPKQKIRFGEVNYLDSLAPFTLIHFSISLTVNMLLVK
ncbi:unnamed protein product [Orchesella dallaii]|uniref:Gustatory receptor n=1 Tax=Orchesella dallaii TaxID=48710 RepID=A0ABP1RK17_9HEXA